MGRVPRSGRGAGDEGGYPLAEPMGRQLHLFRDFVCLGAWRGVLCVPDSQDFAGLTGAAAIA